jgi:hypothetical protein
MVDGIGIRCLLSTTRSGASTCSQSSRGVAKSRQDGVGGNAIGRKAGQRGSHQGQVSRGPRETEGNQQLRGLEPVRFSRAEALERSRTHE